MIKITEQSSLYNNLEQKSVEELTAMINREDQRVPQAIEAALPQLNELIKAGYGVEEVPATEQELLTAEEVFLTNAIYGIRWVKQFKHKSFANKKIVSLYDQFIKRI